MIQRWNNERFWVGLGVTILWILYALTAPQNHSEAEDVYRFAQQVEQGAVADTVGVNRLLALPAFQLLYHVAGEPGPALDFMIMINRVLAVLSLFLFYLILRRIFAVRWIAATTTLLLAFSYGFWRYANEAETYMLAIFFLLASWLLVLQKGKSLWMEVGAALLAGIGVMVHLLNVVPLLFIIPFFYLLDGRWRRGLLHGAVGGLLVAVGYGLAFHLLDWGEMGAQLHPVEVGFGVTNLFRGIAAFGQGVVSGNFLFGFSGVQSFLQEAFPSRVFLEEIYMGQQMPAVIPWIGLSTLLLLGGAGGWLLFSFLRNRKKVDQMPFFICCGLWLFFYVIAILRTEAGSPELWIPALIPAWLLASGLMTVKTKRIWLLGILPLLFVHNLVGGLLPVMSQTSDYHAAKSAWLIEHASAEDLILTSYEPILLSYLAYYSDAEIINSGAWGLEDLERKLDQHKGMAYALPELFWPLSSMEMRNPILYQMMADNGKQLETRFEPMVHTDFGSIFTLKGSGEKNE